MTECAIHARMDAAPQSRATTVRCLHLDGSQVQDRTDGAKRWIARQLTAWRPGHYEIVLIRDDAHAAAVWAAMEARLLAGAPYGEPYPGAGE